VRLFSSLGLVVAPPACEPDQDSAVTSVPRLDRLTSDRPPRLAVRWPDVTGLASYLSGHLSLTGQRCRLWHRRLSGEFNELCRSLVSLPVPQFTGIGRPHHPSSDSWLPVPRRCAEPQGRLRSHSGPAAEPYPSVTTGCVLGETSLPGFTLVCRQSQSGHGSDVFEISTSVPVA
jgi:hypothetical protein